MKTIRIDISIPISPQLIVLKESKIPGGFPEKFGSESRVPNFHTIKLDNHKIAIGPDRNLKANHPHFPNCDLMLLSIRCNQIEFDNILKVVQPAIETIFDHLSFQLQETLFPINLNLIDVTPKINLNEEREFKSITEPASILLPKYFTSQIDFRFNSNINPKPSLSNLRKLENRNEQISLWWYLRALHSPFLIDQINYLFIALDNISKPHKKGPYKTDCNHEILNCPKCDKIIEKQLAGDSVKEYLVKSDFTKEEAKKLWDFRQIVHGKDLFNYLKLQEISSLINRLKLLIFNRIKHNLNLDINDFPMISALEAPVISQNISMSGSSKIEDFDLNLEHAFDKIQ